MTLKHSEPEGRLAQYQREQTGFGTDGSGVPT